MQWNSTINTSQECYNVVMESICLSVCPPSNSYKYTRIFIKFMYIIYGHLDMFGIWDMTGLLVHLQGHLKEINCIVVWRKILCREF